MAKEEIAVALESFWTTTNCPGHPKVLLGILEVVESWRLI